MENFDTILLNNLRLTQENTCIEAPSNTDEVFDFLLTFFELLGSQNKQSASLINLISSAFTLNKLTKTIFQLYVKTPYDQLTLNIILVSLIHTWVNDDSDDLSKLSHKINTLAQTLH